MKRNNSHTYAGLTRSQAIELKGLSYQLFRNNKCPNEQETTKEFSRYTVLLNIRMDYLRSLHTQRSTTFLPQSNNFANA